MLRVALTLVVIALYIYFIIDVIQAHGRNIRALPKFVWILLVVLIPLVSWLLWVAFGKPRQVRLSRRSSAPDDDTKFLDQLGWELRKKKWKEDHPDDK